MALRDQFFVNRSTFDSVQAEAHLRSVNKSENLIKTDLITLWHQKLIACYYIIKQGFTKEALV